MTDAWLEDQQDDVERAAATSTPGDGLPGRLAANAGMNYLADAVIALSAVVLTPILLHHLGVAAFGVWSLAGTVTVYLELFEFGFGTAAVKQIAADAYKRPDEVVATFNTNVLVLAGLGLVGLVVGLVGSFFAPALFDIPDALRREAIAVFGILTITMAASVPLDVIGGSLAGHQRYDLLSAANAASVVLLGVLSVAVVVSGGGIVALAVVNTGVLVAMQLVRWRMLKRIVPGIRFAPRLARRDRARESVRLSGWFLLREVAEVVILRVDLVVVGAVLGVEAATVYAIGGKLATLARRAVQPISKLFFPHAASLGDDRARLAAAALDGGRATLLVGLPACLVLVVLAGPAVEAWVGSRYGEAADVLVLLTVGFAVFSFTETWWYVLMGAGRLRLVTATRVVEAAVNIALSIVLALEMGAPGVALGTLVAAITIDLPTATWAVRRHTDVRLATLLRQVAIPHLPATALSTVTGLLALTFISAEPVPVIAAALAMASVYVVTYFSIGATSAERGRARRVVACLSDRLPGRGG